MAAVILVEADRCQTSVAPDFKQLTANKQEYLEGTRVYFYSNQHEFGACRALFSVYFQRVWDGLKLVFLHSQGLIPKPYWRGSVITCMHGDPLSTNYTSTSVHEDISISIHLAVRQTFRLMTRGQ